MVDTLYDRIAEAQRNAAESLKIIESAMQRIEVMEAETKALGIRIDNLVKRFEELEREMSNLESD